MKKLVSVLVLSALILPSTASANTLDTKNKEQNHETTLTLVKEKYDGYNLIRYYQDEDEKTLVYFLELPSFLQKKISTKDDDAIGEIMSRLATYYSNSKVNNLEKLNVLFYQFVPEFPDSKINVSKNISKPVSSNLNEALKSIDSSGNINLTNKQISELKVVYANEKFQKEYMPYLTQKKLIEATHKFSDDIETKWYENTIFYIVSGIVILLIGGLFIVFRRR
ncbi:hypothetical protein AAGG74_14570 [Bacillus mexicanus]|uniref:hypothetical protein n=1 Tax=Bacillus mexicanus TaxID=2834415 RepID=UPI003D1C896C